MENTERKQNNSRRFSIALTPADYQRLVTLAKITGRLPAQCARDVIMQYLDRHAADIEETQKKFAEFEEAKRGLQVQLSLFDKP